jgi:L-iditol 2-dehydrogenase
MKAVAKTHEGVGLEIIDVPEPETHPGTVKVRIHACGICGSDLKIYQDAYAALRRLPFPRMMGHEPSGVVTEVGAGVTRFREGDRVYADVRGPCGRCDYCRYGRYNFCTTLPTLGSTNGAFAQYAVMNEELVHTLPAGVGLDEGVLMEPLGVAVHAVTSSSLQAGDTALVVGPGPIGLLVAMVARAGGAGPLLISGLSIDAQRLALARELGFRTVDVEGEDLDKAVRGATGGRGVDVVYDTAGYYEDTLSWVRKGGELIWIARAVREISLGGLQAIQLNGLRITTSFRVTPLDMLRAKNLVESGQVDPSRLPIERLPLADAEEAFRRLERRDGLKIALTP